MRLDRRGWARAISLSKCLWGFKGIANPSSQTVGRIKSNYKQPMPLQIVLSDESFMGDIHFRESEYVATSSDYQDEWEVYVKQLKHTGVVCPHGPEEGRVAYRRAVAAMLGDKDARLAWAKEYVDFDWIRNAVSCFFQDEESTYYFVKDHPVDSVWRKYETRWVNLDYVMGYCPSCDEPLTMDDQLKLVSQEAHPFNPNCQEPNCDSDYSKCNYNIEGYLRDVYECNSCNWADVTQDVEWDDTFLFKYRRPFNWPPGAPYPPRRSFSGFPMDVPPYED